MMRAVATRFGSAMGVMFGLSVLVFLIFFATPGADPAARIAGRGASPETLATVRHDFGFDRPLPVQYVRMMTRLFVTRDLTSFVNRGEAVVPEVIRAAPVTLALATGAAVLWLAAGLLIGVTAAVMRGRAIDRLVVALGLVGVSVPAFWLGEVVNLVTQNRLHDTPLFAWVPPLGERPFSDDPAQWMLGMVIPCGTLALLFAGVYGRVLRTSLIDALQQDYVRTARATGASEWQIVLKHALPLSLISIIALFGLDFSALVGGGTLLTEVVFGLHGLGRLTYDALQNLDLPVIMATVLYAAFFVVAFNAAADLLQQTLDPRLR